MPDPDGDVTRILSAASAGDASAADRLLPLVYSELRGLAAVYLRQESSGHTLPPTALVHEAYLRLVDQERATWRDRGHFFSVAALVMRRILVNHARDRGRLKRGGDRTREPIEEIVVAFESTAGDLVALDEALEKLRAVSERRARVVELRFFAGLTSAQIAEVTESSERSVERDWMTARAWLKAELDAR